MRDKNKKMLKKYMQVIPGDTGIYILKFEFI